VLRASYLPKWKHPQCGASTPAQERHARRLQSQDMATGSVTRSDDGMQAPAVDFVSGAATKTIICLAESVRIVAAR
jgi:hypothetical protein